MYLIFLVNLELPGKRSLYASSDETIILVTILLIDFGLKEVIPNVESTVQLVTWPIT